MTIVCTGSIAYDYLMTFPGYFRDQILPERLELISLSFLVDLMVRQRGGVAPNIAYTLALLGAAEPKVMGTVGVDFTDYRIWLDSQGVDTSWIKVIPEVFTASFFANTDKANAQISSFYSGAMAYAGTQSLKEMNSARPGLVIISPNDPKAMDRFVIECGELGIPYLYDPGQQVVRSDPSELHRGVIGANSLFVNDYEYDLLQKHTGLTPKDILSRVQYLVVTRGENGASVYTDSKEYTIPVVKPERTLDPTGVGDAFRAGFVRGVCLGLEWQTCGQIGALAATYVLEQKGTQNHHFTVPEFIERYRQNFDDQGALDALLQKS